MTREERKRNYRNEIFKELVGKIQEGLGTGAIPPDAILVCKKTKGLRVVLKWATPWEIENKVGIPAWRSIDRDYENGVAADLFRRLDGCPVGSLATDFYKPCKK